MPNHFLSEDCFFFFNVSAHCRYLFNYSCVEKLVSLTKVIPEYCKPVADKNECESSDACESKKYCVNTPGSFKCEGNKHLYMYFKHELF